MVFSGRELYMDLAHALTFRGAAWTTAQLKHPQSFAPWPRLPEQITRLRDETLALVPGERERIETLRSAGISAETFEGGLEALTHLAALAFCTLVEQNPPPSPPTTSMFRCFLGQATIGYETYDLATMYARAQPYNGKAP